jgi:hypothetical protein
MRSRVRFPVSPWEFSFAGEDPRSDHGLGSLYNLGLRPLLSLHTHTYHHSHHRGIVTAPHGRPTSEVGYTSATTGRGDHEVHKGHVVALEIKKYLYNLVEDYFDKVVILFEFDVCGSVHLGNIYVLFNSKYIYYIFYFFS